MNNDIPLPWHPFVWDVNNDGSFTVTDLGLWLHHAFFLPGDWLIWMMLRYTPEVGRFLEVDSGEYGSTVSALLSVFSWLGIIVLIMTTSHYLAAADRVFTGVLRGLVTRGLTRLHIVWRALGELVMRRRERLPSMVGGAELPKLKAEELRVLKAHAYIDPASSLALSDLVRATGVPRSQIVDILDRLREMQLLDRRVDAANSEAGYCLTDPGRALLSATRL
jgi:DNA-binding MarR family transcriptional regulator